MEIQRSLSDCFLRIEAEVIHHNKSQLSVGEPPRLSGAPAESLDFIKVWISEKILNLGFISEDQGYGSLQKWCAASLYNATFGP